MKTTIEKPIDECTLEELEAQGFEGVDASLEISLGEYGLICKHNPDDDDYFCIIGYRTDQAGNYISFYTGHFSEEDINEAAHELGGGSFFDSLGEIPFHWKKRPFVSKAHDLKNHIGPADTFGSPSHLFQMFALLHS